ncbi:MAG: HU family DNA-binding protein [Limisphaerales bacterium]|jgi:nucleoid DNA-binding protein
MTLTKRLLVERIQADLDKAPRTEGEKALTQQEILQVVQKTLDHIAAALGRGEKVELRNFGVFEVKTRKARVGRNPKRPDVDVPIPARAVVRFKAGKEMRADVLRLATPPPPP